MDTVKTINKRVKSSLLVLPKIKICKREIIVWYEKILKKNDIT
jgi:hypothetical protein